MSFRTPHYLFFAVDIFGYFISSKNFQYIKNTNKVKNVCERYLFKLEHVQSNVFTHIQ